MTMEMQMQINVHSIGQITHKAAPLTAGIEKEGKGRRKNLREPVILETCRIWSRHIR